MRFYEKSGKLTQNLQLSYDALAQISPTSVPSEREFLNLPASLPIRGQNYQINHLMTYAF